MTAFLPTPSNTLTPEPPTTFSRPRGLVVLASALCVWLFTSPIMGAPFSLVLRFSYVLLAVLVCELLSTYKQLRAVRHGADMALRAQEDRFQALVENSADGIILVSPNGTALYASPSARRVLGYSRGELLGRDTTECIYSEDRAQVRAFLADLSQRPGASVTTEFRCRQKGSTWRWIEGTGTNLLNQPGIAAIVVNFRDIEARKKFEEQLRVLAATDPLTGLSNYRRLIETLDSELKRSDRTARPFAVLLVDLDNLKRINDRFGHLAGSRALCRVAEVLRTHCRVMDTPARYGGDEFTIILPESDEAVARSVASRISQHLASDLEDPRISVSVGIAVYPKDGNTIELLLSAADRQLYEMKYVRHCHALQGPR